MAPATRLCLLLPLRPIASAGRRGAVSRSTRGAAASAARAIHSNPAQPAKVAPVYGTGPPPEPPQPSLDFAAEVRDERLGRRKRQAEMLKQAGDIRAMLKQQRESGNNETDGIKRRFWKDVNVREVNGAFEIHLDARPLRHPTTKTIIRLPPSKPHLAHALALEWDALTSAQQATKQHLIPLTSLICRALDIASEDSSSPSSTPNPTSPLRTTISQSLLRYLDTDSLLCFAPAPEPGTHDPTLDGPSLRTQQEQAYTATVPSFLTAHVWPGITIEPVLDGTSLLPRPHAPGTRDVVQGWMRSSLSAFELAGLERATLGGKSLLAAARLVVEWSEEGAAYTPSSSSSSSSSSSAETHAQKKRFGVEEAARAVSLEVAFQTGRWGEVEDTHDVEKEDLRRQLGSVVLLVSGNGSGSKSG
ncbi:protein atp12, mitochondrial [Chaetomidium leptoderma]|uniref:Protein atp12, mitochondrial n=1 Tax=Chaetomidium leptoderma TaxID=669021 RepID=A0AAN6VH57_9PEZI|nr:protein atp12, mitochondrial [Chaetomidium leptoderma]